MKGIITILLLLLSLQLSARQDFKVGTWNLWHPEQREKAVSSNPRVSAQRLWCNSSTAVADMLGALDCDIMGLQEICDSIWTGPLNVRDAATSRGLEYEWIIYPNTAKGTISYDSAIAYRPAVFECVESGIFWLGGVYDRPEAAEDAPEGSVRPAVWARMKHKASGREFYFFCTHLLVPKPGDDPSRYDGNKYNAMMLREKIRQIVPDDMPAILVGDMNVDEKGPSWNSLANCICMDARQYMQRAEILANDAMSWGTQNLKDEGGFSRWWPDHIMFNGFRPLNYVIHREKFRTADGSLHYPSDHFPLTCDMQFRDYSPSGLPTPPPAKKSLRLMSFNVRYFNNNADFENGWDHRKRAIPSMLEDVRPDVFGTQEITDVQLAYLDRHCPQYRHVGIFREGGEKGECASVFYNTETTELLDWGGFWLSETPDSASLGWDAAIKRTAVWAKIKVKATGKTLFFVDTHLDHKGPEAKAKGLDLILDTLAVLNKDRLPAVVVGDLNMNVNEKGLQRIASEMLSARDNALQSDEKYSFNGFGRSWTGNIDYIWYRGMKKCRNFRVISRKYNHINYISDHYPIAADFDL